VTDQPIASSREGVIAYLCSCTEHLQRETKRGLAGAPSLALAAHRNRIYRSEKLASRSPASARRGLCAADRFYPGTLGHVMQPTLIFP
jgi:hypothetical protein